MANYLFWGSLGILLYIYLGYFVLLKLLAWLKPIQHQPDEQFTPSVTLLFSAYNECASLPAKIGSIRQLDYPRDQLQVLAASDASTDATNDYLLEQADVESLILTERGGKNRALNALFEKATGDILFFTDANTVLHPQSLRAVTRHFANAKVGMVSGQLIFAHETDWNAVGRGTSLYWRYENSIKEAENRLGSLLVGNGSVVAARRDRVGALDPRIANDLEIPTRIGAQGDYILFEPECRGYEKPHTDLTEELSRTSRIVARGLRGFAVLLPLMARSPMRLWQFISHKFLRWFTLPLGILMLVGGWMLRQDCWFAAGVTYVGLAGLAASLVGAGLLLAGRESRWMRPFTLLGHLLVMYLGAVIGLWQAVRGKTPAAWNLPQSSR